MSYCSVVNVRVSSIACIKSNLAGWKAHFPSCRDWFLYSRLCRDRRSFASEVSRNLLTFFLSPSVWNSCYILSSRSFFVKNFFQDFFYRSDQSLSATFIEYHLSVSFVKYFFVLFQLFLMIFSVSLKDSLVIISCQNRYVNYFL